MLFEAGNDPLTREEEKDLLVEYQANQNNEALEKLMAFCFPAVVSQAYKFSGFDVDFDDLVQEGMIGLLDAIKRFDVGRDVRLLSYARLVIRHTMMIYTAKFHISVDLSPAVRTASFRNDNLKKINTLRNVATDKIEREVAASNPEDLCYRKELKELIFGLMDKYLNDNQKMVISRRMLSESPETLSKLGKNMSLTGERVRQIETKALEIIKDRIKSIKDLRSLVVGE